MEDNAAKKKSAYRRICETPICKIMVPILVILILLLGALSIIDAYYHTRGKNFVVLEQRGVEIQRIVIEPGRNKTTEVPIWYNGQQYYYRIEITGGAARLTDQAYNERYSDPLEGSVWIHDPTDVYTYEPLKLKLYFE